MNALCYVNWHRDFIAESRTFKRTENLAEGSEQTDFEETKQCRCGVVIHLESHTRTRKTIIRLEAGSRPPDLEKTKS